jgi:hypothetical protein
MATKRTVLIFPDEALLESAREASKNDGGNLSNFIRRAIWNECMSSGIDMSGVRWNYSPGERTDL